MLCVHTEMRHDCIGVAWCRRALTCLKELDVGMAELCFCEGLLYSFNFGVL